MGKDVWRLAVCALASLVLIALGGYVLDWFRLTLSIDGAAVREGRLDLAETPGQLASLASWSALAFGLVVAFQAGRRLTGGPASGVLVAIGALVGLACAGVVFAAAYVAPPTGVESETVSLSFTRAWGPACLLAGQLLGIAALFLVRDEPVAEVAIAVPRAPTAPIAPIASRTPTAPIAPIAPRTITPPRASVPPPLEAIARVADKIRREALRGKLQYATATAELTVPGIDARREDGHTLLVLWRDVVGIVARRLPAATPYEGAPFVDVVSTAGSTLRLLPWTRLTGGAIDGEGDARMRALVRLLGERCPHAQLDPATRTFADGSEPPAQLRDAAKLAAHDARLA